MKNSEVIKTISPPKAANSIEVIYVREGCAKITFEGGGQQTPIPDVDVGFSTVQFPGWITLTSGNYFNEPSPVTIAYWVSQWRYPDNFREIIFSKPISGVELFYASAYDLILEAYDEVNRLIASTRGPANYNNRYRQWKSLSINKENNVIKKLRFIGHACYTSIDDLIVCAECRGLILED